MYPGGDGMDIRGGKQMGKGDDMGGGPAGVLHGSLQG